MIPDSIYLLSVSRILDMSNYGIRKFRYLAGAVCARPALLNCFICWR